MGETTYRSIIEQIARRKSTSVTVFADFCRMAACALAAGTREDEYFEAIKRYEKGELSELSKALGLLINEMESKPFTDVLGPYYLDIASHSSKQARGEFYTPPEISKIMAKISIDFQSVKERGRPITVNEPACGAGSMMLAIAEEFAPDAVDLIRVTCQDINPVAVDMCYINMTLWGVPAKVVQGDVLRNTVTHSWKNIHWLRVGEDQRLAYERVIQMASEEPKESAENGVKKEPEPMKPAKGNQAEFDFDLGEITTNQLQR